MNVFHLPKVIVTGQGCLTEVEKQLQKQGVKHILVVTDKGLMKTGLVDKVKDYLIKAGISVSTFDDVEAEPPFKVVDLGVKLARQENCDGVLGFGGGSSIDSAKGIALVAAREGKLQDYVGENKIDCSGLPTIMIPTTAGTGSEGTGVAIFTDEIKEVKVGIASPFLIPDVAIVDPELTL